MLFRLALTFPRRFSIFSKISSRSCPADRGKSPRIRSRSGYVQVMSVILRSRVHVSVHVSVNFLNLAVSLSRSASFSRDLRILREIGGPISA